MEKLRKILMMRYAEKESDGYRLMVAIADVSHYVQEGTELDKEAFNRGKLRVFSKKSDPNVT